MLTVYKSKENNTLSTLNNIEEGCWINAVDPSDQEINYLSNYLNIDKEDIYSVLDAEESARLEQNEDYQLIIFDVPIVDETSTNLYTTIPIAVFLLPKYTLTVCLKEVSLIQEFINNKVKNFSTYESNRFLLQILYKNSSLYLQYLRNIDKYSKSIEKELRKSLKNNILFQLYHLEKSLVFFTTSLHSNQIVLEKLDRIEAIKQNQKNKELLQDVIIENKQAIEMSNVYSDILSGMMAFFSSVISNNLNIVMKTLTSITIVLYIPTLIASLFGMNVPLPLAYNKLALLIIILFSFSIATIIALIMRKKNLF